MSELKNYGEEKPNQKQEAVMKEFQHSMLRVR
jgi:hypothetical protein